jgi:hypothetical protein
MKPGKLTLLVLTLLVVFGWPSLGQTSHNITLSWGASTTSGVKYAVYRATASSGPYAQIATDVATLSYTDASGVGGTAYYYEISAVCDATTSCASGVSGESAKTPPGGPWTFLGNPGAPAGAPTAVIN